MSFYLHFFFKKFDLEQRTSNIFWMIYNLIPFVPQCFCCLSLKKGWKKSQHNLFISDDINFFSDIYIFDPGTLFLEFDNKMKLGDQLI